MSPPVDAAEADLGEAEAGISEPALGTSKERRLFIQPGRAAQYRFGGRGDRSVCFGSQRGRVVAGGPMPDVADQIAQPPSVAARPLGDHRRGATVSDDVGVLRPIVASTGVVFASRTIRVTRRPFRRPGALPARR